MPARQNQVSLAFRAQEVLSFRKLV